MRQTFMVSFASALIWLAVFAPNASASETLNANQHLCTASDLQGTFSMINVTETPEGAEASWYRQLPYHYLTFYPGNRYATIALDHPVDKLEDLNAMLKEKSDPKFKFTIAGGVLELLHDTQIQYSYLCFATTDTDSTNKKGDLMLSGHALGNSSKIYKLYRAYTKDMDVK